MSNEILNSLIKEYEQKKLLAELDLEKRKNDLYKKVPKLKQIEDDLNQFAINTAKNILKNNEASINELEIKASQLKKEKIEILKNIKAQHFMLSHRNPFDNSKDSVIRLLDGIYAKRKSGEPYISGIDGE